MVSAAPRLEAGASPTRVQRAWRVLAEVLDPEVPALSVCDLGIVRDIAEEGAEEGAALLVVLTPTYSGCPATEVIAQAVVDALQAAGLGPVRTALRRAPAWSSDWISDEGRRKLRDYGIAPPGRCGDEALQPAPLRLVRDACVHIACPRCGSARTEQLSAFGSTACKALHRCLDCREPFEYFKPV